MSPAVHSPLPTAASTLDPTVARLGAVHSSRPPQPLAATSSTTADRVSARECDRGNGNNTHNYDNGGLVARARACLAMNVVQRCLSAAVLAPLVTIFLWESPAFATASVCSFLTSLCLYEYTWLAHRIQFRLLLALEGIDIAHAPATVVAVVGTHGTTTLYHDSDELAILQSRSGRERHSALLLHVDGDAPERRSHLRTSHGVFLSRTSDPLGAAASAPDRSSKTHILDRSSSCCSDATVEDPPREAADPGGDEPDSTPMTAFDPCQTTITTIAERFFCGRSWLAAAALALVTSAVTSALFLGVIFAWIPELNGTELYPFRVFYVVSTTIIAALCACFTPNWRYAVVVVAGSIGFTFLTVYSTVCPINQFRCALHFEPSQIFLAAVGFFLLLRMATGRNGPQMIIHLVLDVVGIVYILGTLSVLVAFVDDDKRTLYRKLLIVLLYVTWASDTGAYVTGKILAWFEYSYYHPLAAHLSKNKDYEGTFGAIICGVAAMLVACRILDVPGDFGTKIGFTVFGVIVGRVGDLFESLLKRAALVKDSGTLIPGHGGVLDRIDALMFVTLVFARYYALVIGIAS